MSKIYDIIKEESVSGPEHSEILFAHSFSIDSEAPLENNHVFVSLYILISIFIVTTQLRVSQAYSK